MDDKVNLGLEMLKLQEIGCLYFKNVVSDGTKELTHH